MSYALIDSGEGKKLEDFGKYRLVRPCSHALWSKKCRKQWASAHAHFSREEKRGWVGKLPTSWSLRMQGLSFKISATDFGHLGFFPEHQNAWQWIDKQVFPEMRMLNLFAYSGAATLVAAKKGAKVCHLDASSKMVDWAKENAKNNRLEKAPVRWIVDDVRKFVKREIKRASHYDAIVLDPPSFGRGNKGEVFKIEEDIFPLLHDCKQILSKDPQFVFFSCHTPGFSPTVLQNLLECMMGKKQGKIESGEMCITSQTSCDLPLGCYARWSKD